MKLIIPIIIILVGFIPIMKYWIKVFLMGYKKTTGYIVDYKKSFDHKDTEYYYHAIVEFTVGNNTYRCIDNYGGGYSTHKNKVNSKVKIVYQSKDPSLCFVSHNVLNTSLIVIGTIIYIIVNYII